MLAPQERVRPSTARSTHSVNASHANRAAPRRQRRAPASRKTQTFRLGGPTFDLGGRKFNLFPRKPRLRAYTQSLGLRTFYTNRRALHRKAPNLAFHLRL